MPTTTKQAKAARIAATGLVAGSLAVVGALGSTQAHADEDVGSQPMGAPVGLENFDVTVDRMGPEEGVFTAYVTVCPKGFAEGEEVRVSWDAWSLDTAASDYLTPIKHDKASYPIDDPNGGPSELYLTNGECGAGTLVFPDDGSGDPTLNYESSLGDRASWLMPG